VTKWLLLMVAIVCEVTATLALRGALDRRVLYVVVVVGYVIAFWSLAALLRKGAGLGVVYGIWSAAGVAATALLSAVIFDERLTPTMLVGIVLIVAGVLVVESGSRRAHAMPDKAER
jgi:small multidrug resistance pump